MENHLGDFHEVKQRITSENLRGDMCKEEFGGTSIT